jgi:hypothetical protein
LFERVDTLARQSAWLAEVFSDPYRSHRKYTPMNPRFLEYYKNEQQRSAIIAREFSTFVADDDWAPKKAFDSAPEILMNDIVNVVGTLSGGWSESRDIAPLLLLDVLGRIPGCEGLDWLHCLDRPRLDHPLSLQLVDNYMGPSRAADLAKVFDDLVTATERSCGASGQTSTYRKLFSRYMKARAEKPGNSQSSSGGRDPLGQVPKGDDSTLLGLGATFTDEELQAAWKAKARQWHPDRLEGMAPELSAIANQELAKINAARDRLAERLARARQAHAPDRE